MTLAEIERRAVDASPMARDALLMVEENEKMVAMARKGILSRLPDFGRVGVPGETDRHVRGDGRPGDPPLRETEAGERAARSPRLESGSRLNSRSVLNDLLAMVSENYRQGQNGREPDPFVQEPAANPEPPGGRILPGQLPGRQGRFHVGHQRHQQPVLVRTGLFSGAVPILGRRGRPRVPCRRSGREPIRSGA